MVTAVKAFCALNVDLTAEERNLLAVAYKSAMAQKRNSWRGILEIEEKEGKHRSETKLGLLKDIRDTLEKEMSDICKDVITLLERNLLPSASSDEARVFFQKMYD